MPVVPRIRSALHLHLAMRLTGARSALSPRGDVTHICALGRNHCGTDVALSPDVMSLDVMTTSARANNCETSDASSKLTLCFPTSNRSRQRLLLDKPCVVAQIHEPPARTPSRRAARATLRRPTRQCARRLQQPAGRVDLHQPDSSWPTSTPGPFSIHRTALLAKRLRRFGGFRRAVVQRDCISAQRRRRLDAVGVGIE